MAYDAVGSPPLLTDLSPSSNSPGSFLLGLLIVGMEHFLFFFFAEDTVRSRDEPF